MIDRLERLINLIIALRESRVPLRAADVRERVAGYGPRYGQHDPEAFRRMFERDKADLRALGVPIETTTVDGGQLGDDRTAYRIDPRRYDLPPVELGAEELAALSLAVQATGLGDEVGWGLRKLVVDAGDPDVLVRADLAVGLDLHAPHRATLIAAQVSRTAVRFRYAGPGGQARERTVEPHALVHRRGRWYVVGHDRDRGARRAFRLDRVDGPVRTTGRPGAFDEVEDVGVDDVVPEPPAGAPATATLRAASEVAWLVARRARGGGREEEGGWTVYEVPVGDPDQFVGWVLDLGPDIELVAPEELRDLVVEALDRLEAAEGADR